MRCMAELGSNKRKMVQIGTHSGTFHCDEALGCWMLNQTSAFKGASIVRSRDPEVLAQADVVIDVGGVYDPAIQRFDHHQRGFTEVFGHGFNTKLSSAGLVYKHYGQEIIAGLMGVPADHADVQTVWLQVGRGQLGWGACLKKGCHCCKGRGVCIGSIGQALRMPVRCTRAARCCAATATRAAANSMMPQNPCRAGSCVSCSHPPKLISDMIRLQEMVQISL